MKGKWAAGIPPRNFTWVIKDRLAVSERPGGFAPNHRKVRRQEEIIWLQVQGFTRVVSLLPSSHNLQAYEEKSMASVHFPLPTSGDARAALADLYRDLHSRLIGGRRARCMKWILSSKAARRGPHVASVLGQGSLTVERRDRSRREARATRDRRAREDIAARLRSAATRGPLAEITSSPVS